jgi:hypothetical protein
MGLRRSRQQCLDGLHEATVEVALQAKPSAESFRRIATPAFVELPEAARGAQPPSAGSDGSRQAGAGSGQAEEAAYIRFVPPSAEVCVCVCGGGGVTRPAFRHCLATALLFCFSPVALRICGFTLRRKGL